MFRMSKGSRTARGLAAAALILSLTATTFAGGANAAPLTNKQECSVASQARSAAVTALHDAWKASASDLKALVSDAPKLRKELFSAWHDLKDVLMQAKDDLKALGLGAACQDKHDNDDTAPVAVAATTTTDTAALDAKAKAIVDQAIKDMKAVIDAARKAIADLAAATPSKDTTTDNTVKGDKQSANTEDNNVNEDVEDKNDDAKDNSSEKSKAKLTTSTTLRVNVARKNHGHDHND